METTVAIGEMVKIIAMYSKGMNQHDMEDNLREIYGGEIPQTLISKISDDYAAAKKRLENPPRLNIYVSPMLNVNDITVIGQANPNIEFAAAPLGSYQVVDITGSTITLSLKNMKGMSIAIYELGISQTKPEDLLNKVGKQVRFANFKSDDSKYIIVGLKQLTNYNITIADPKERVVLSKPIRTFYGGNSNIM